MLRRMYDAVMDPEQNPLSALPKMVRFQIMVVLAYLWSAVFTIWVGSIVVFGPTVAGHLVLLVGVFCTTDVFRRAWSKGLSHRDAMRNPQDDTVLYDDIWGAPARLTAEHGARA